LHILTQSGELLKIIKTYQDYCFAKMLLIHAVQYRHNEITKHGKSIDLSY